MRWMARELLTLEEDAPGASDEEVCLPLTLDLDPAATLLQSED
jgi:hypothetical protein